MPKMFLRIRFAGAKVLEVDPEEIKGFSIQDSDEAEGGYLLTLFTAQSYFVIEEGSFDQCHARLNRLHTALDCHLHDVN